jgi:hypothetical protein
MFINLKEQLSDLSGTITSSIERKYEPVDELESLNVLIDARFD